MDDLSQSIADFLGSAPPGVGISTCLIASVSIFLWWRSDQKKRAHRKETRGERMARLKQEAIEKLRAEKDVD